MFVPLSQQNKSLQTGPCWRAKGLVQAPHIWEGIGAPVWCDGVRSDHACDSSVLSSAPRVTSALPHFLLPPLGSLMPARVESTDWTPDTQHPFRQMSTFYLVNLMEERSRVNEGWRCGGSETSLGLSCALQAPNLDIRLQKPRLAHCFPPCGH